MVGIIDIIIIALLLVAMLYGFCKGFTKQVWGSITTMIGLALGILLAGIFGVALQDAGLGSAFDKLFVGMFEGNEIAGLEILVREGTIGGAEFKDFGVLYDGSFMELGDAVKGLSFFIPKFVVNLVTKNPIAGVTVGELFTAWLNRIVCVLIAFLIIFLAVKLLGFVLKKIIFRGEKKKKRAEEDKKKKKGFLNRLCGALVKGVSCFIAITVIFSIIDVIGGFGHAENIYNFLKGGVEGEIANPMAVWFLEKNWFAKVLAWVSQTLAPALTL